MLLGWIICWGLGERGTASVNALISGWGTLGSRWVAGFGIGLGSPTSHAWGTRERE